MLDNTLREHINQSTPQKLGPTFMVMIFGVSCSFQTTNLLFFVVINVFFFSIGNVLFQNTSVATLLGRIMSIMGPFQQKLLVKG